MDPAIKVEGVPDDSPARTHTQRSLKVSRLNGKRREAQEEGLKVKVAILGAGGIAHQMARTLSMMTKDDRYRDLVTPYAVASRSKERAQAFADTYGFPVSYGSYEELMEDPQVDLVYIATPHNFHASQACSCLRAGKNVLVEKSFTVNADQARQVIAVARRSNLLCAEAIWPRYMPSRTMLEKVIDSGRLGRIRTGSATLCGDNHRMARMSDPDLAGGALLDMGVYTLNFLDMTFGPKPPSRITTDGTFDENGLDEQSSTALFYEDGTMGLSTCSMVSNCDARASIWGSDGYLVCDGVNNIKTMSIYGKNHELVETLTVPEQLTGYEYEVASAANAILDGRCECPEMRHEDTIRIMELMDSIRGKWSMRYPFES